MRFKIFSKFNFFSFSMGMSALGVSFSAGAFFSHKYHSRQFSREDEEALNQIRYSLKKCSTGKLKDITGVTSNEIFNRLGGYSFTCEPVDESGYRFSGRTTHVSAPYKDSKAGAGIYPLAWTAQGKIYIGAGRRDNRLVFIGGFKRNPTKTAKHLEENIIDEFEKKAWNLRKAGKPDPITNVYSKNQLLQYMKSGSEEYDKSYEGHLKRELYEEIHKVWDPEKYPIDYHSPVYDNDNVDKHDFSVVGISGYLPLGEFDEHGNLPADAFIPAKRWHYPAYDDIEEIVFFPIDEIMKREEEYFWIDSHNSQEYQLQNSFAENIFKYYYKIDKCVKEVRAKHGLKSGNSWWSFFMGDNDNSSDASLCESVLGCNL